MSYWEVKAKLHQLFVRTLEFDSGVKSEAPDWTALWEHHLELCQIEKWLEIEDQH